MRECKSRLPEHTADRPSCVRAIDLSKQTSSDAVVPVAILVSAGRVGSFKTRRNDAVVATAAAIAVLVIVIVVCNASSVWEQGCVPRAAQASISAGRRPEHRLVGSERRY
jgi:hypothetical protein